MNFSVKKSTFAITTVATTLFSNTLFSAPLSSPAGASVNPTPYQGNFSCSQLIPGSTELKVEPVTSGTYSDGTLTVTIISTGTSFDFTSNILVDAVFVKAGSGGNLYDYRPGGTLGDTGLIGPINPNTGNPYGLSHISFCYTILP